jgi:hypothetical protein
VKQIADRLSHSSPIVTMRTYTHILPLLEEQLANGLEDTFREASARAAAPSQPPERPAEVVPLAVSEERHGS